MKPARTLALGLLAAALACGASKTEDDLRAQLAKAAADLRSEKTRADAERQKADAAALKAFNAVSDLNREKIAADNERGDRQRADAARETAERALADARTARAAVEGRLAQATDNQKPLIDAPTIKAAVAANTRAVAKIEQHAATSQAAAGVVADAAGKIVESNAAAQDEMEKLRMQMSIESKKLDVEKAKVAADKSKANVPIWTAAILLIGTLAGICQQVWVVAKRVNGVIAKLQDASWHQGHDAKTAEVAAEVHPIRTFGGLAIPVAPPADAPPDLSHYEEQLNRIEDTLINAERAKAAEPPKGK